MRKQVLSAALFCLAGHCCFAQPDAATSAIRKEGLTNSKVMDMAFHLTDGSGPRLTNSPGFLRAANWAKDELTKMGLVNASLEPWGDFGKGWEQNRCYVAMTAPYYNPVIAIPRAWTGSTPGKKAISSEVILIKAKDSAELHQNYAGKLKGKIVMFYSRDTLKPSFVADGERFTDEALDKMANAKPDTGRRNFNQQAAVDPDVMAARRQQQALARQMENFYKNEEPALVLSMNARGNDGTLFVQNGSSYSKDSSRYFAWVMLSSDDYLRIQRLVESGQKVEMEADVKTKFYDSDIKGYNVIAEIPGTDPLLKNEIVMLGGHLDSWHGATGATDNAAGCAVMMEVVRILKAIGLQPKRTIRIALWSGEEQGLLGSRAYVKNHFANPADMVLKDDHAKVSAYYNLDNGTGKVRGIYLQGNAAAGPIFAKWLEPFADLGAKTVTINNTGGTDHQAFDGVGIPGFQFIQDEIEYDTRTHHTNMDTYDHLVPDDLKQAATIIASFVYNTAQRDEKIPRKELPKPRGSGGRGGF
ncbi:MAG TPA: M20/M25/M40 family metallo-hydrolase [Ferruginibacter sp.]|nr:peptidase M28 [Chitinophagaceae bacterium]HRI25543.1 M20/M25/M40 family metallo-hydrolase [Ferruginibacter sp.]